MTALVDLWCALTPRARVLSWMGWSLSLSVFALCCLFSSTLRESESVHRQRAANHLLWTSLYPFVSVDDELLMTARQTATPFSPLAIALPGLHLRRWQPSEQGGELEIIVDWQAIPALFAHLAEQGMSVTVFSLSREQDALLLTLTLEPLHD